jgi:hypothetical protein
MLNKQLSPMEARYSSSAAAWTHPGVQKGCCLTQAALTSVEVAASILRSSRFPSGWEHV